MFDKFIKLVVGDLDEKREYKQMMKRVEELPEDYRFAFKKIQKYMYTVGAPNGDMSIFKDLNMFNELIELFQTSAFDKKPVTEVVGNDVSKFCDEFMEAFSENSETIKEKINKEIKEKLK